MIKNEKLVFIARIKDIGPVSELTRQQRIELKDVALMSGYLFCEADGFVRIIIKKQIGGSMIRQNGQLRTKLETAIEETTKLTKQKKFCLDRIEELVRENKSLQSSLFLAKEQIECDKEQVTALYAEIANYQDSIARLSVQKEAKP